MAQRPGNTSYSVEGMYTFADSGESRYARLFFSDGDLTRVLGFTGHSLPYMF